jgi:hypothetical protein
MAVLSAILVPDATCPEPVIAWGRARSHVIAELDALRSPQSDVNVER